MEFRLLGPVEAWRDGVAVRPAGTKQRALLALLLVHANEIVTRDALLEALWPDAAAGASHSLDIQISRLRKLIGPDLLETRPGGYLLRAEASSIDARRFEHLLEDGRQANADDRPEEALTALENALALWRGAALADLAYEPFAQLEVRRLEELRLAAVEERIDAELALGRHGGLVADLESLVAENPVRERLRAQLMLALYRSGRQADALALYASTRRFFVEELGLEPGQPLRQLEQAILRQDASLDLAPPGETARPRRGRLVGAAATVAAAAAAATGFLLASGGTESSHAEAVAQPDSVAQISVATGRPIVRTNVPAPLLSRFGAGALWNLSYKGILSKLDPETGTVIASVNVVPLPCGLAVARTSAWITDCTSPTVVRVDTSHPLVVDRIQLPVPDAYMESATGSVVVGAGSVWVGQGFTNPSYVWRLDANTGRLKRRIVIPEGGAESLAYGDGAVWVGGASIGRLSRIDPATNKVTTPARDLGSGLCCVAAGGGFVWAAVNPGGSIWKIAADGRVVSESRLAANVEELAFGDGAAWASTGDAGKVTRIDSTTDRRRSYLLGHHVAGVAERGGILAASVQPAGPDVTAGLKGRIVTLALKEDTLDWTSTDPLGTQFAFNADQVQFHYATCAKLFNYPDAAGRAGTRLIPEVAAGTAQVTDGLRTYTFRIRRGFGFSPPSREQVTAASFRHAFERVLSPKGAGHWQLLADVQGAAAYHAGATSHVTGITAHGDTLVIRLVAPAGDLPTRLALPDFCAVPVGLPTVPHGLPYPIPTAGPYYLAARSADTVVLKPNPNYHGSRPQHLDAIVYRTGIDVGVAAAKVAQGTFDYVHADDAALAPGTVAAKAAGGRYRLTANNWTERLALNTSRPLFADARARRAVRDALDRVALARALDGGVFQLPTADLLPPNLRRHVGPRLPQREDLRAIRRQLSGRHLRAVVAVYAPEVGEVYDAQTVETLRNELRAIGIAVRIVPLRQGSSPEQWAAVLAHADITRIAGNADDARDPVGYLLHLPYLPAADRARLARISALPSSQRERAAAAVAARLEREAVYIGFADRATPELLSKRLGCVIDHPEYPGVDLAALCLRSAASHPH